MSNGVDVGLRATSTSGSDEGKFQRYRDLRSGPVLDGFRYVNGTDAREFKASAEHVGYRDQHFAASYVNYGRLKVTFDWSQIPLDYSQTTATVFTLTSPGLLSLDHAIQTGIQNGTTTLARSVGQASVFDLHAQRNVLNMNLRYTATDNLDWTLAIKNTTKTGNQPWAGTFGFSDAVDLPVPLDTRTTELGSALEWGNGRGLARVAYDGSFFRNNVPTLTWDNPLRATDSLTAGPAQGRESLWPNSNMNGVSATGLLNLPLQSRVTAYVSVANWSQNDPLIPFTINSTLPVIPLDRPTADTEAVVTATSFAFTSKPAKRWWFSARYGSYDFDNRTPVFHVANTVSYDTTVAAFADAGTSPYSLTRRRFDADASMTPTTFTALRVGYTREQIGETFRTFDTTTEDTLRLSADATNIHWLVIRAVYEHAKRVGTGLDEQTLDDIGEQVSLRQFDISNRTSDRVSAIAILTPVSSLSLNGTVSAGKEDRPGTVFGLRSNTNHTWSAGADYVPRDAISIGILYEFEKYDSLQASREANPGAQFDDPTRDWTTDGADKAQTLTASMDLIKLWPKTNIRVAYDYSHADSLYVYGLAPNSTIAPVVQLPMVVNTLQRGTVDLRYSLSRRVSVGGSYWFDQYRVSDFALVAQTIPSLAQPSFLTMGSLYRPYSGNTVTAKLTYVW